jgi:hypothetical protein
MVGSWPEWPKLMDNRTTDGRPAPKPRSLPNLATMSKWQALVEGLSAPLSAEVTGPTAVLIRVDDKHATRFEVMEVSALTGDAVDAVLDRAAEGRRRPWLLVYDRSSPASRGRLREAGVSYLGADGRVLLQAPPLYVDRDRPADRSTPGIGWGTATSGSLARNPFAVRGSRVARWALAPSRPLVRDQ